VLHPSKKARHATIAIGMEVVAANVAAGYDRLAALLVTSTQR